jgi:adenosylmethionine-8-amino-7-oxononanoate aminotransferase
MHKLARLDRQYVWHPFTQMRDWLKREPIVIASGRGAVLRDIRGREYLDANSSIWTNLHGHNHPKINSAIRNQLGKIAHSSALGLANEPASLLAEKLVASANAAPAPRAPRLAKVFYSDDGSTAMEVALKLAYVYARRTGHSKNPKFLSLQGAYHGDTLGAVGLGHIDLFHKTFAGLLFKTDRVMAPYCYRCPFNRARPERADARDYRKCNHECISFVEKKFAARKKTKNPFAAMVVEPLMQGAAGMIPQPAGWLRRVAEIVRDHGAQLIADEVMTGFGRAGQDGLSASHLEGVQPDFIALAKGLTGGYLPMAATLTTQPVFDAFLGDYDEFKTFFHGHSFTGNQLGAAAALASLDILQSPASIRARRNLQSTLRQELRSLWALPNVGDIRQVGLVVGIELVRNWRTRKAFNLRRQAGIRVCEAMARRGVLTRPIGNVVVLMPPYCATSSQVRRMVAVLAESIDETFPPR